jgi:hypothetical protein
MSDCSQESIVAAALAKGELPEELRLHLAGCAVCGEVHSIARRMLLLADGLAEELTGEPRPSAASMWWRLNLRIRRDRARRAEMPLIWMTRIFYAAIAILAALLVASMPGALRPAAAIGLLALGAVVLPVAITLWGWSRWKI